MLVSLSHWVSGTSFWGKLNPNHNQYLPNTNSFLAFKQDFTLNINDLCYGDLHFVPNRKVNHHNVDV